MKTNALIMVSLLLFSCNLFNQSGDYKKANNAEVVGNTSDALKLYVETLLRVTPSTEIPDIKRSKFMKSDLWKKEIEKHLIWHHSPVAKLNKNFQAAMDGTLRCLEKVHTENSLGNVKILKYSPEKYSGDWGSLFFDPMVQIDPLFAPITRKCYTDNISIFKIKAPQNYAYEVNLLNKTTGKKINFSIYPESDNSVLVTPGDHLLICRSTVVFPETHQVWFSQYSVFPINIPQQASEISVNLITSVAKERLDKK